jgi:prepilin-type N-terminal cleavage/methylation domain-containing protein
MTSRGAALRCSPPSSSPASTAEAGFTLLELMVVIGIVAILIAVTMPTLLGARRQTQQRAAQANLTHALEAANIAYIDVPDFSQFSTTTMSTVEPGLRFTAGPDTAPVSVSDTHQVAVTWGTATVGDDPTPTGFLALAEPAGDGTCWYVLQTNDSTPTYGRGVVDASQSCTAADATNAMDKAFSI